MKSVAVIFGGESVEREVSILTALEVMAYLRRDYEVVPIYIDSRGWWADKGIDKLDFFKRGTTPKTRVYMEGDSLYKKGAFGTLKLYKQIDVVYLMTHGGSGENGDIQGLLNMHKVAFTSCDTLASAICMDKYLLKKCLKSIGVPTLPATLYEGGDIEGFCTEVERKYGYPVIVKPVTLGSSIGISVARDRQSLVEGIEGALLFDTRVMVEKYLEGKIELNQSAYMGDELRLSMIERPISKEGMLTFWDKYGGDVKSMSGSMREMPANIDSKLATKINSLTTKVYKALDLKGIVRIDYLYTEEGGLYLNEINTIPGSMALYLYGDRETWSDILGETVRYAYAYKLRKDAATRDFGCDLIHSHSKGVKNS